MTHSQKQKWKRKKRVRPPLVPPPSSALGRARARGLGSARRVSLSGFKEEPPESVRSGSEPATRHRTLPDSCARTHAGLRQIEEVRERVRGRSGGTRRGNSGDTGSGKALLFRTASVRPFNRCFLQLRSALLCFDRYLIDPHRRGHGRTRTSWVLGNSRVTRVSHVLRSRSCQTTPVLSPLSFSFIRCLTCGVYLTGESSRGTRAGFDKSWF